MRIFYFTFLILILFISFSFIPDDDKNPSNVNQMQYLLQTSSIKLDANQISSWFRNNGSFNRDPFTGNSGFEWPKGSSKFARYASGMWIGAVVEGDTLVTMAEYDYEYLPGYTDNFGNPQGTNDPGIKIFKITKGVNDSDRANWPNALLGNDDQGAPVYFDTKLNKWLPLDIGSQTQYYIYTDSYPEAHNNNGGSTAPLKADIKQTNFAFNAGGHIGNMIFSEFKIINRSTKVWNDFYLTLWTDDDLGDATDDMVACDTILKVGYTYNGDNNDGVYGTTPPAVGFVQLKGPDIHTGNNNDSVFYCDGKIRKYKTGYRKRNMDVFNWYNGGGPIYGDPQRYYESYRMMSGLNKLGNPIINPLTNQPTKYFYSGDPVTGQGWINGPMAPDDQRFMMSTGPADVNPGDTQHVIIAQVIGRGTSNLNSITKMKEAVLRAENLYNTCFENEVTAGKPLVSSYAPDNGKIYLTWDDNAEKQKLYNHYTNDFYNFEGYNIYQVRRGTDGTNKNDRILLATFDIKNNVRDIYDSIFLPEYNSWTYGKVQSGSDNGVSRYIVIEKDHFADKLLYKGSLYYFAVTAYYYDTSAGAHSFSKKVIESNITEQIIEVIPQNLTQGTTFTHNFGDTIRTNRKDYGVKPVIIDPLKVISADYTSLFYRVNDTIAWKIFRTVNNNTTTLIENVFDFSGSHDTARIIDGMMLLHSQIKDSGVVRDKDDPYFLLVGSNNSADKGWDYQPPQNQWVMGLDTQRLKTARFISRQFQSRSMSISWPYQGGTGTTAFRGLRTKVVANGKGFIEIPGSNGVMQGGPLRKVKLVFGETQKAYRFAHVENGTPVNVLLSDTALLTNTPYIDMADIPFRIYEIDDMDSTALPRQLNAAFIDADANGTWDPDTTKLGKYQILYILASDYNEVPNQYYTIRNPGPVSPSTGFPSFDIMYAWMPRVRIGATGEPMTWTSGDELIIYPYIITKDEFVPGFNITYSWSTKGAVISNRQNAVFNNQIENVNVFPNPYYVYSGLEATPGDRFIYFSNLPAECTIYIYALNGTLIKKIVRNETDPERSLERWDIRNEGGNMVSSGMYIAAISAPGIGSKVLKLAVFNN